MKIQKLNSLIGTKAGLPPIRFPGAAFLAADTVTLRNSDANRVRFR
jgi:hypothetical protein